jgi:hypothetical protein
MSLNAAHVLVGTADQTAVTGAIRYGAVLTTPPANFAAAETAFGALTGDGVYVSEDGLELGNDMSTADIRENCRKLRKLLDKEA